MKLKNILNDFFKEDLSRGFLEQLEESYNTNIHVNWKSISQNIEIGDLEVNDEIYRVKIEAIKYYQYNLINVMFSKIIDGIEDEQLTWTSKGASRVLGAIVNALNDRISTKSYDGIVCIANDNIDKRMSLYNKLLRRFGKHLSRVAYVDLPNGGRACGAFNNNISEEILKKAIFTLPISKAI